MIIAASIIGYILIGMFVGGVFHAYDKETYGKHADVSDAVWIGSAWPFVVAIHLFIRIAKIPGGLGFYLATKHFQRQKIRIQEQKRMRVELEQATQELEDELELTDRQSRRY